MIHHKVAKMLSWICAELQAQAAEGFFWFSIYAYFKITGTAIQRRLLVTIA